MGLEAKSGTAWYGGTQRAFYRALNAAVGALESIGHNGGRLVRRVLVIRRWFAYQA